MNTSTTSDDLLFELERQIARRADELARQQAADGSFPLESWLQAETQVWCEFDTHQYGPSTAVELKGTADANGSSCSSS